MVLRKHTEVGDADGDDTTGVDRSSTSIFSRYCTALLTNSEALRPETPQPRLLSIECEPLRYN